MQELDFIFAIAVLIMSVVVHEVSHGYVANSLGDPTAKYAGRLTLNPIKHLDFFGSFLVPFFLMIMSSPFVIGWAKPVPYNPYNLKDQKKGPALVAISGPLSNFLIAIVFGIGSMLIPLADSLKTQIAIDLITKFSLQGGDYLTTLFSFSLLIVFINIILGVFNLIPIPPLDGSKVLFAFLPYKWVHVQEFLERYGFFLLLILIFFGFLQFIGPIIFGLFKLITGIGF